MYAQFPRPFSLLSSVHAMGHRYAYFKKIEYLSTECIYSPDAYRGHARAFLRISRRRGRAR